MSAQQARDMRYGRRGGGWADGPRPSLTGPACDVCGEPCLLVQRTRHFMCEPTSIVGRVCTCPPDCTDTHIGNGPRDCDPACEPCVRSCVIHACPCFPRGPETMSTERDEIHEILLHPENHVWQVQGFGMLRTYLDGPNEPRLQVWDQRLATWSNNAIHDHPWAFTSTIYAGMLYNQRYTIDAPFDAPIPGPWSNGHVTEIVPGTRGGKLSERPIRPCLIKALPIEVYAMGDTYSQTHREMHLTRYLQGTVSLIERTEREADDIARVAWFGAADAQPPFVNPYEPTAEQTERTISLALDAWFTTEVAR